MEKLGLKGNEEENMGKLPRKGSTKAKAFKAVEKMKSFGEAQQMQDPRRSLPTRCALHRKCRSLRPYRRIWTF